MWGILSGIVVGVNLFVFFVTYFYHTAAPGTALVPMLSAFGGEMGFCEAKPHCPNPAGGGVKPPR
jgi:hypothetical protein